MNDYHGGKPHPDVAHLVDAARTQQAFGRLIRSHLDVERADYVHQPGRIAVLTVGPLCVWANTADEPMFGFTWSLRRWSFGWTVESFAEKDAR